MVNIQVVIVFPNVARFNSRIISGEKENLADFPDLCMFLLGRVGQWVSVLFSALSLLGASAVYWVLMSNFLYHTVKYVYGKYSN